LTPSTITEFEKLEKELGDIRRRGFAEVVDELEEGLSGVAAVVRGGMGEVLGALSICGPSQRMSENRRAQLGVTLCTVASRLQPRY
jgi:DNA-binding IclR family transcriptional regulator